MQKVKLGNYVEQIRGVSYKPTDLFEKLEVGSVILLRANNIFDSKVNFEDVVYVDKNKVKNNQFLRAGDILICTSSGSKDLVGKAAYIENDLNVTFGAFCKVIRPKGIESAFLGHFFQSQIYRHSISESCIGVNINNIRGEHIDNLEVPLPSLSEQKAIAEKLDKVSILIEKRKQQLSQLDFLVKSQFIEMFGDPFTTTEWDKKPLREVSVSIYDGSNIPKDLYCSTGSIVFYRIQNVWRNEYHLDDLVYISSGTSRIYSDSSLNTNDILITKIGRFYTKDSSLGRVALYKGETGKAHFSNNIMRIRLKAEVKGEYINALLNLDVYQAYIKKVSVGGTDKRALSKMIIGELPIPVPPIDLQKKFVALLEQTDKSKFRVKQSLAALELLKKSLMQKYFG